MIQEITTYLIVSSAVIYTAYNFVKFLIPNKKNASHGCSGSCSGCSMKSEIHSNIHMTKLNIN